MELFAMPRPAFPGTWTMKAHVEMVSVARSMPNHRLRPAMGNLEEEFDPISPLAGSECMTVKTPLDASIDENDLGRVE